MKRGFILLVLLGLLAGWAASVRAQAPIAIVAFGDSWTEGRYVDRGGVYPAQLEAALRDKGYAVTVQNAGVDGDRSDNAVARRDLSVPPGTKIALVEFGLNDARAMGHLPPVDPAAIKANLDAVVRGLQARGVEVLLIGARGLD